MWSACNLRDLHEPNTKLHWAEKLILWLSGSKVSDLAFEEFNGFPRKNTFTASPKLTKRIAAQLVKPLMFDYSGGHIGDIHASAEVSDTVVNIIRGILGFFQVTVKTTQTIYSLEEVNPLNHSIYSCFFYTVAPMFDVVCRLASTASVRVATPPKQTHKQRSWQSPRSSISATANRRRQSTGGWRPLCSTISPNRSDRVTADASLSLQLTDQNELYFCLCLPFQRGESVITNLRYVYTVKPTAEGGLITRAHGLEQQHFSPFNVKGGNFQMKAMWDSKASPH